MLDLSIPPKPLKPAQIGLKFINLREQTYEFLIKRLKRSKFEKKGCQVVVAMETSSYLTNQLLYQSVAQSLLGKVTKFGDVYFYMKNVMNIQSQAGHFVRSLLSTLFNFVKCSKHEEDLTPCKFGFEIRLKIFTLIQCS